MQKRMLSLARGYMSSDQPLVHFGLGDEQQIDRLTVRWPSGIQQSFENLAVNQHYEVTEQGESNPLPAESNAASPMFTRSTEAVPFAHHERPFDDFFRQRLLPNRLSTLGPGQAWGDCNADGLVDVFVGGARGQAGQLLLRTEAGGFTPAAGPWVDHQGCEDMGIAWLDVDSDGDLDLYVGSGSNEVALDSQEYQDRLYLNDGKGLFIDATSDWLPSLLYSTSVVCPADFDRDGDLDLFVGSRMVPGQYPRKAASVLLRNTGQKMELCTEQVAPALPDIGLVTDAVWTDFNNDGQIDLAVVSDLGARDPAGKRFRCPAGYGCRYGAGKHARLVEWHSHCGFGWKWLD